MIVSDPNTKKSGRLLIAKVAFFSGLLEGRASLDLPITGLLTFLDYVTPIVLLFFFLAVFTLRSILAANNDETLGSVSPPVEYGPPAAC